jgi:hypothetical protein
MNSMKNMRNNTLKLLVLIALFCPAAIADDGEMGGGGLYDSGSVDTTSKSVINREEGEMGGGGRAAGLSYLDFVMDSVYDCFDRLM